MKTVPVRFLLVSAVFAVGFSLPDNGMFVDLISQLQLTKILWLYLEICPPLLDIAFVLDASGSIEEIYSEQVRWTASLSDVLPIHQDAVRLAMIQYAGYPLTEFTLNSYSDRDEVVRHLQDMNFQSGVTRTGYALKSAEDELFSEDRGARHNASKIIALFTDGLSIDDPLKPSEQLRHRKGVKIYVVSVSADGFIPEMQRIAGANSNVFGPDDLPLFKERLLKDVEDARVCESEMIGTPLTNAVTESNFFQSTDLADFPAIEMSTETLTTKEKPSFTSSEENSTPLHDNEVRGRTALHSAEAATTPMSPDDIFERVLESRTSVPVAKTQRRIKKIRRVLRRKLKRGPGLKRVDSSGPVLANKVRKIIRKTKLRKIISRTSSGSVLPPVTSSTTSTAFPQLLRPEQLQPLKETFRKNTRHRLDSSPIVFTDPPAAPTLPPTTATTAPEVSRTFAVTEPPRPTTTTAASTTLFVSVRAPVRAFASKTFERNAVIPLSKCPLDILFVVDSSGSVGDIYVKQKEFLSELLLSIQPENQSHRVALIQFAGAKLQKTEWLFDSFQESTQLIKAFNGVRHFTGTTYIGAALELAQQLLEKRRPDVKTVVVLLSDGFSQDDATRPADAIRAMKNVEFYAVSLSRLSNRNYLHQLVKDERRMAMDKDAGYMHNHLKSIFHCNN
ncbi:hypothetical protein Y032_0115g496 [Ancylostoma ceylanicum]|uniref:VWFA domain-containing protein n=1 Tax=Ancylostoma ceylanicum TaxID=53326 RepID=A0A016TCT5_9BILA|nr:hypothetical protein Y032_0115g496 [Ancylostoma ceylanicum]